ncbi:hypothetical protein POX46_16905, partial [Escherichia coli]
ADRNRSHWSTSKTPSYTKSVSWQHHRRRPRLSRRVGFFPRNQKKSQYFYPSVNLKDIYAYFKNYL